MGLPNRAAAGGTEFPADGTRNLGRGGAGMARADDPSLMVRNPALLADLWGDQALLGAHLLLVDSCFQPTGGYQLGPAPSPPIVSRVGGQTLYWWDPAAPPQNLFTQDGQPVVGYQNEPYPNVCYEGPTPFLPRVALTMKIAPDLGVGIGFFPPDISSLNQFGNRDGSVDTPNGPRPNPLRHQRVHLNTSYFSVLGAIGYRMADWIRVGLGFQWQVVAFQSRSVVPALGPYGLSPSGDVRSDAFGRDLFIPGLIGSVHIVPFDALDIALGFKWSDRVMSKTKLDLTSGAGGVGEVTTLVDANGNEVPFGSSIPTTVHNQTADVSASPIWVPQLSLGVRFADRFKPRVKDSEWAAVQKSSGDIGEDSMAAERWDIELDVIYYFTSFQDRTSVDTGTNSVVELRTIDAQGGVSPPTPISVGDCIVESPPGSTVQCERRVRTPLNGKDQLTLRLGGDYNVLPGLFTVRAGVSYEADGQDPGWMSPFQYMAERIGAHGGFTIRVARKTDISFGLAHFLQKEVELQFNPDTLSKDSRQFRLLMSDPGRYHWQPGAELDGVALIEVPNTQYNKPGPYYVNAGSYFYDLTVLSASVSQKF